MPAVGRIGDPFSCGDTVKAGSPDVFCNGMPVARLADGTTGHPKAAPTTINAGSGSVFVNGMPLARVGDTLVPHGGGPHSGAISAGSTDVNAG